MHILKDYAIRLLITIFFGITLAAISASGIHVESSRQLHHDPQTFPVSPNGTFTLDSAWAAERAIADDVTWAKAVCKGQKLFQALTTDAGTAGRFISPVNSPWDGTLIDELKAWGYHDISDNKDSACNFHLEQAAFAALGINYKSKGNGGPNRCFAIEHQDGPTVIKDANGKIPPAYRQFYTGPNGLRYQVTRAYADIGVNADDGVLYFINRKAPSTAAKEYWPNRANNPIRPEELPPLSASSDFAWGFWNQANTPDKIKNIQKIMSLEIINEHTGPLIDRALESIEPPPGQPKATKPQPWPGTTFVVNGDSDALALLGSPNGLGAGYFLAQHKAQLGNKVISKITVWQVSEIDLPNMLFWVADELEPEEPEEPEEPDDPPTAVSKHVVERSVIERSDGGGNVVREHTFRAKL